MGRWSNKSGIKRFKVKVNYLKHGTARITLPKPLVNLFESPDEVIFEIENGRIFIYPE